MSTIHRRVFLKESLATVAGAAVAPAALSASAALADTPARNLSLARFHFDVTPPMGHSLCGGWIKPVLGYDDPLEAIGLVLLGAGKPIVLCAVDWTGLLNQAHIEWRRALAEAAGTTPDRVSVHCVHQHNAPFACLDAERYTQAHEDLAHIVDLNFYRTCLDRAREAVKTGIEKAQRLTHVAVGQGKVEKVASNRRVVIKNGRIQRMRGSSSRNPEDHKLPEGLIDPWLKTVAFYDKDTKLAACHYYATHPMSYYGDGRVSSDFAGLARKRRQKDEPNCTHIYFTGCAGNVAAGKYNDGSKERRPILMRRMYDGIAASERNLEPEPIERVSWRTHDVQPPVRNGLTEEGLTKTVADPKASGANRGRAAYRLAWLRRTQSKVPIVLSALHINNTSLLHLPAECFIEYQLRAQEIAPKRFVATAAYGDGGPWYVPTKECYPQGGYEVSVAFCDPPVDDMLTDGMRKLLS